ncbi:hypothetical protein IAD21_05206 [Abditibacteriota bacterium]|nr:hypothetical protein IAD21_05206 [Abditibacteriota bacterium]
MAWVSSAYGLWIESEILLSELSGVEESFSGEVDVTVRKGSCPLPQFFRSQERYFELNSQTAFLFWRDTGAFWLNQGREVIIEPSPGVADHLLRPVLLGTVLAVLLYQRGLLVLHASAVALRKGEKISGAVGFLGDSGQGKSTMATALYQCGHQPLADDTIALTVPLPIDPNSNELTGKGRSNRTVVYPALPHFKLRPPSIEVFGETKNTLTLWHPEQESYVFSTADKFSLEPAPLRCLYVLEDGDAIHLELLPPHEALMNLLSHSYCMRILPDADTGSDFLRCAQLARQIPVFRLRRPRDFRYLQDVVRLVEEHDKSSPLSSE